MKSLISNQLLLAVFGMMLLYGCAATKNVNTASSNQDVVKMWIEEGWNKKNHEAIVEKVFSADWYDANPMRADQESGIEGIRKGVAAYLKAFPDTQIKITHITGDHKYVAVRYEITATHLGKAFGVEATGKKINTTSITIYEMKDGKIAVSWQEFDLLGILNQLEN